MATIRINGNVLTEAQVLTFRTALNAFAIDLQGGFLGDEMTRQYAIHVDALQSFFMHEEFPEMAKRGFFEWEDSR